MDQKLIELIKDNPRKFYLTKIWKDKRHQILERDNFECQLCKEQGKLAVGEGGKKGKNLVVHHKKHLTERPNLALTDSNLITVCKTCHNQLHPEKRQHKKFKEKQKPKIEFETPERW